VTLSEGTGCLALPSSSQPGLPALAAMARWLTGCWGCRWQPTARSGPALLPQPATGLGWWLAAPRGFSARAPASASHWGGCWAARGGRPSEETGGRRA